MNTVLVCRAPNRGTHGQEIEKQQKKEGSEGGVEVKARLSKHPEFSETTLQIKHLHESDENEETKFSSL